MTKDYRRSHIKTSRKGGVAKSFGPTLPGSGWGSGDMSASGVFPEKLRVENWGYDPQTRVLEPGRGIHITYGYEKWAFCPQGRDRNRNRGTILKDQMHILFVATHPGIQGKEGRIYESHVMWIWDLWLWRAEGTAIKILVLSHSPIL